MALWYVAVLVTVTPWRFLWHSVWEYRRRQEIHELKMEMLELRQLIEDREFILVQGEEEGKDASLLFLLSKQTRNTETHELPRSDSSVA